MATFTINSRIHGPQTFFVPASGGHVYLEGGNNHGVLGQQICHGGRFRGYTLTADAATLPAVARKWWRAYLRNERGRGAWDRI